MTAVFLAVALSACGGGGSSTETAAPAAAPAASAASDAGSGTGGGTGGGGASGGTTTGVVAAAGTLQASAPVPSYAAASLGLSAFTALNTAREKAGAGVLQQSTQLDASAAAHAQYIRLNLSTSGLSHGEDSTKTGYYAATPGERVAKAGFSAVAVGEVIASTGQSLQGGDCMLGLLGTVYHAALLLSQTTHVGLGFDVDASGAPFCVADIAIPTGNLYGQVPPAGSLIAYPYDGQSQVLDTFWVAYESPRPPASLLPNQTAGTPVVVNLRNADYVNFQSNKTLDATVTAFALKDAAGNAVPAVILAQPALKAAAGVSLNADATLSPAFAVLVPLSPLTKGQTYTASFSATLKAGATPLSKTWRFTTAP